MQCLEGPKLKVSWLAQIRNQTVNYVFSRLYFCSPNGSVNMSQINYPLCKKGSRLCLEFANGGDKDGGSTSTVNQEVSHPTATPDPTKPQWY